MALSSRVYTLILVELAKVNCVAVMFGSGAVLFLTFSTLRYAHYKKWERISSAEFECLRTD